MRVLVTGVSGFVGCRLARHLVRCGHHVVGTYIRDAPEIDGVDLVEVDLLETDRLIDSIRLAAPEAVVHLAGLSHVGESWQRPAEYFRVNVLGTKNVLLAMPEGLVLVASSAEVYGDVPEDQQPISEDRMVAPQSPYAMTKAAMELLAIERRAIVVRSFNIVGPGQACTFALPAFANQLASHHAQGMSGELRVGNLAARRDFVHIDDAVEAMTLVLESGEPGATYNLGTGQAHSIEEVLHKLIEVSGLSPLVVVDPDRFRPVDLPLLRADNTRLLELGWQPSRSLDVALRDLWTATVSTVSSASVSGATSPTS
jgi:GDP-4-dehydro-6-deoxy-D-mannose reductase